MLLPESRARLEIGGVEAITQHPEGWRVTILIKTRSGDTREIDVNLSAIEWDGQPAYLGVHRDMTEQRRLEQQFQQSQRKLFCMVLRYLLS